MKKTLLPFIALAGLALGACATSTPEGWTDDFEAAKARAAAEGKLLLVDFSGSDWCGWCKRLDKEVFSKPEFLEGVKNDFVLVFIDAPRDKSLLSEKAKKQNPEVKKKYSEYVEGYPTVLLLAADGSFLDKTGYRKGGAEAYVKHLAELRSDLAARAALAAEISGLAPSSPERMAKIDAFLSHLDRGGLRKNRALAEELFKNDPDGGFAQKYAYVAYLLPVLDQVMEAERSLYYKEEAYAAKQSKGRPLSDKDYRAASEAMAGEAVKAFSAPRDSAAAAAGKVEDPEIRKQLLEIAETMQHRVGYAEELQRKAQEKKKARAKAKK